MQEFVQCQCQSSQCTYRWCSLQWGLELDQAGRPIRRVFHRVTAVPPTPQLVPQYGCADLPFPL